MIDRDFDEAASEAAFSVTSAVLHRLRPRLRSAVADDALGHPAYAGNNFPIWWQHQNNDHFIKQAKPPFFRPLLTPSQKRVPWSIQGARVYPVLRA